MKKIDILLDFDGTCVTHAFPSIGKDIGAIPVLKQLQEKGHRIFLNTMRCDTTLKQAVTWLEERGITITYANINPEQRNWTKSPKMYGQLSIDDINLGTPLLYDAVSGRPYVDWKKVEVLLKQRGLI